MTKITPQPILLTQYSVMVGIAHPTDSFTDQIIKD